MVKSIRLRTLGTHTRERLLETYTLVVDAIGIIAIAALMTVQRPRRARGRWPSG